MQSWNLATTKGLTAHKTAISAATHQGEKALRVVEAETGPAGEDRLAIVDGSSIEDGVIEVELSGEPSTRAGQGARGFVGIAFRVSPDQSKYECFYLRPTNGRADDQVRRNHSAQYVSFPDFPWERLRKEFPEKYESYVDLEPGVWTRVRIEVRAKQAKLFVHGNAQPSLIVNDLKHGVSKGAVALWIGPGTVAHFRGLKIAP